MPQIHRILVGICLLPILAWMFADYEILWTINPSRFQYNKTDLYWSCVCLLPVLLGHFISVWGNYYRASEQFDTAISKVTTPTTDHQKVPFWQRHSLLGYSNKFWALTGVIVILNLFWFFLTFWATLPGFKTQYTSPESYYRGIGYAASQNALMCCTLIIFLVLRRSVLQAIGFTAFEVLPLHNWLGVAILCWVITHAAFYSACLVIEGKFTTDIAFTDIGRGTRNMPGVFALGALIIMSFFSLPVFRRKTFSVFIYVHRASTFIFLIGLMMHYPSIMLWYYLLPSYILFLIDRFVPKMIQASTINPMATATLNADAEIICMKFSSVDPIKPYFPGDYVMVQIPGMGNIYHPFTIASYWPEDPQSMTLYMRVFSESKHSWTRELAKLCGNEDQRIMIRANVNGVFGERRHDYLKSEVLIMFVAGASMTTFMPLIKAIAAQIAVSREPLRLKLHFICTFRTRAELHAYGSFLHQITRDSRFTSWLHVEIYVSRPDKASTLMGSHAHVVKNDIQVPTQAKAQRSDISDDSKRFASLKKTSSRLKRALSGRTIVTEVSPSISPKSVSPIQSPPQTAVNSARNSGEHEAQVEGLDIKRQDHASSPAPLAINTRVGVAPSSSKSPISPEPTTAVSTRSLPPYEAQSLPTYASVSVGSIAKRLALRDLLATALMVTIPMAIFYSLRSVEWEGSTKWCQTTKDKKAYTIWMCYWTYALIPGLTHTFAMLFMGYFGIWAARRGYMGRMRMQSQDVESAAAEKENSASISAEDGNWDEGDVVYTRGRLDAKKLITGFVNAGVGMGANGKRGLVTVFAGGPEGFLNVVEKHSNEAEWTVDFNRETWSP